MKAGELLRGELEVDGKLVPVIPLIIEIELLQDGHSVMKKNFKCHNYVSALRIFGRTYDLKDKAPQMMDMRVHSVEVMEVIAILYSHVGADRSCGGASKTKLGPASVLSQVECAPDRPGVDYEFLPVTTYLHEHPESGVWLRVCPCERDREVATGKGEDTKEEFDGKLIDGERAVPDDLELELFVRHCFYDLLLCLWCCYPSTNLLTQDLGSDLVPVLGYERRERR